MQNKTYTLILQVLFNCWHETRLELFLDFGLRMAARSPAEQTFLTQLCAGGTMSYLATEKAVAGESYSACLYCNEVSPAGGQQLVEETLTSLNALWA